MVGLMSKLNLRWILLRFREPVGASPGRGLLISRRALALGCQCDPNRGLAPCG